MSVVKKYNAKVKKKARHAEDRVTAKEAPRVRKWVLKYLNTHPHLSLNDLANRFYVNIFGETQNLYYTDGFYNQAKLMLAESRHKPHKPVWITDNLRGVETYAKPKSKYKFIRISNRRYKLLASIAELTYDIHTRDTLYVCKKWNVERGIDAEQLLMGKIESI